MHLLAIFLTTSNYNINESVLNIPVAGFLAPQSKLGLCAGADVAEVRNLVYLLLALSFHQVLS